VARVATYDYPTDPHAGPQHKAQPEFEVQVPSRTPRFQQVSKMTIDLSKDWIFRKMQAFLCRGRVTVQKRRLLIARSWVFAVPHSWDFLIRSWG
jgi:hypothetical protein